MHNSLKIHLVFKRRLIFKTAEQKIAKHSIKTSGYAVTKPASYHVVFGIVYNVT